MSSIADDFGRLGLGGRSERRDERYSSRDGAGAPYSQYQPQGYGQPSPQPYPGQPPSSQGGHYPPPQQSPYSSPPPRDSYGSPPVPGPRPPPPFTPPADKPRIPAGWIWRWDDTHQRWYYVEEATGRAQWEAPGYDHASNRGTPAAGDNRGPSPAPGGYFPPAGPPPGAQPSYGAPSPYPPAPSPGYGDSRGSAGTEKKGGGNALLGAAGGLAVGAIAGAVLMHEGHKVHEKFERLEDDLLDGGRPEGYAEGYGAPPVVTQQSETIIYENNDYIPPPQQSETIVYETNNYYVNDEPPRDYDDDRRDYDYDRRSSSSEEEVVVQEEYREEYREDDGGGYVEEYQEEYRETDTYYDD